MQFDIVTIGELLIDFLPQGNSPSGNPVFEQKAGGAVANVVVAAQKLGSKCAFIGKLSNDSFGSYLKNTVLAYGVDCSGVVISDHPTTLAFVHLNENGDRSFSFYRTHTSDIELRPEDIDFRFVDACRAFHFGAVSLTDEPAREATLTAVRYAKNQGKLISFDPNLRPLLWSSLKKAKQVILQAMGYADIVKLSEEELVFLTGSQDILVGTQTLYEQFQPRVLLITLGEKGCFYRMDKLTGHVETDQVRAVDTTGAGDAFMGAFLHTYLKGDGIKDESKLRKAVAFANKVGTHTTLKKGAMEAMPLLCEL